MTDTPHSCNPEALRLLNALFENPDDVIDVRFIPTDNAATWRETATGAAAAQALIEKHASRPDLGIYIGVASRASAAGSGGKENLARVTALWVDIDDITNADARDAVDARIREFPYPPSIIVHSGGGLHLYWCLDEPCDLMEEAAREAFEATLRGLADYLGGDRAATDSARVLRVPGTTNWPNEKKREAGRVPVPCSIEFIDEEQRYSIGDFEAFELRGRALRVEPEAKVSLGDYVSQAAELPPVVSKLLSTWPKLAQRWSGQGLDAGKSNSEYDFAVAILLARRLVDDYADSDNDDDMREVGETIIDALTHRRSGDEKHTGYFVRTAERAIALVIDRRFEVRAEVARAHTAFEGWDGKAPTDALQILERAEALGLYARDGRSQAVRELTPEDVDAKLAGILAKGGMDDAPTIARTLSASRMRGAIEEADPQEYIETAVAAIVAHREVVRRTEEAVKSTDPALVFDLDRYPLTQVGLAYRFHDYYGDSALRHVSNAWLAWSGKHYAADACAEGGESAVGEMVGTLFELLSESLPETTTDPDRVRKHVRDLGSLATRQAVRTLVGEASRVDEDGLDLDAQGLNCQNGIVDLATGDLRPHARAERCTMIAGADYQWNATCPTWERFIEDSVPDAELRHYVQKCLGYSLLGDNREQVFFFLYGGTGSGKSTIMAAIDGALGGVGGYGTSAPFDLFLRAQGGGQQQGYSIARLARKRLVTAAEPSQGQRLDEGRVKNLTGDDVIEARGIFERPFTFKPKFALWFVANDRPEARADDHALYRRMIVLPFNQSRPEGQVDVTLHHRLANDPKSRRAVLRWLVDGALAYFEEGSGLRAQAPETVKAEIDAYRTESDRLGEFVEAVLVEQDGIRIARPRLWKAFQEWCEIIGVGRPPMGRSMFYRQVEAKFGAPITVRGTRCFDGVDERSQWQVAIRSEVSSVPENGW